MASRKGLPVVKPESEGLGLSTIMDPGLAARHGVPYVHLSVFAIDVDRLRVETESDELDPAWPFGWEVFLTAVRLREVLDPDGQRALVEDMVTSAMEAGEALGAQLPFAVYALIIRGDWPRSLSTCFRTWKRKPDRLVKNLAPLFEADEAERGRLSAACLEVEMEPPLSAPTREALRALCGQGDPAD